MAKKYTKKKMPEGGPLLSKKNPLTKWTPPTDPKYKELETVNFTHKIKNLDDPYTRMQNVIPPASSPIAISTDVPPPVNYPYEMTKNAMSQEGGRGRRRGYNGSIGRTLAGGLALANAIIPGDEINMFSPVQPERGYNPNPYGTGSQAIMKAGGELSASKAKEMLKDGKAHGKKLTKKQKGYFGWVAGGKKAAAGLNLGGPDKPMPIPIPEGEASSYINPTKDGRDSIDMSELISTGLISGKPLEGDEGKALFDRLSSRYGQPAAQSLITEMFTFNQEAGNKRLSPEERITRFFGTGNNSQIKSDLNRYGYGAADIYNTSPNIIAQKQRGVGNQSGLITKMEAGGTVKKIGKNIFDGGTIEFVGKSHARGGIDIAYAGKNVEVENAETATMSDDGTLNIMGNMKLLGTNRTFKQESKKLAKKENIYTKMLAKATELEDSDDRSMIGRLNLNTAKLMRMGGVIGSKNVANEKQELSAQQNMILRAAQEMGVDPIALSEGRRVKAKKGAHLKAANGMAIGDPEKPKKKSVAQRHNNPGNIKWGDFAKRFGATKGEAATDGGNFAIFPDTQTGMKAIKSLLRTQGYSDLPVDQALKRWTGGTGYNLDISKFQGKKVKDIKGSDLDELVNTITYGEDGRYYQAPTDSPASTLAVDPINTPTLPGLPTRTLTPEVNKPTNAVNYEVPELGTINVPDENVIPSDIQPMSLSQVLPEIYAIGQNRPSAVPLQSFSPQLLQDYEVSLQDRRNLNTGTFNALQRQIGDNPAALSTLAGQLYEANNQVNAEEFRINQANQNTVRNYNVQALNDAQLKNLALADQQFTRQAQGQAKTRTQNQVILNSIAGKELQHLAENRKLALYENLYDFRFDDRNQDGIQDVATYYGPEAQFNMRGTTGGASNAYVSQTVETDATGAVKRTRTRIPSQRQQEEQDLKIQDRRNRIPAVRRFNLFNRKG